MNRETFMHNVELQEGDVVNAFENLMALYCICSSVGEYNNIKVSMTSSELASFDLILDNVENAKDITSKCNNVCIPIYDKHYNVQCIDDNNIVHITLYNQV